MNRDDILNEVNSFLAMRCFNQVDASEEDMAHFVNILADCAEKDRNGKDVWEGDLLRTPEGDIMVAEWRDAQIITRCVRPYNPRYKNSLTFAYPVSVVIGNIYDNPELLEEKK